MLLLLPKSLFDGPLEFIPAEPNLIGANNWRVLRTEKTLVASRFVQRLIIWPEDICFLERCIIYVRLAAIAIRIIVEVVLGSSS